MLLKQLFDALEINILTFMRVLKNLVEPEIFEIFQHKVERVPHVTGIAHIFPVTKLQNLSKSPKQC